MRVLPAAKVDAELARFKDQNPHYPARFRKNMINALDRGLTQDMMAPYRACVSGARKDEQFFEVKRILAGKPTEHPARNRPDFDFTASNSQVWTMETSAGHMCGLIHDDEVLITAKNPEDNQHHVIFRCSTEDAAQAVAYAEEHRPGRYAYDLLAQLAPKETITALIFLERHSVNEGGAFFGVATESGVRYMLVIGQQAAGLISWPEQKSLGKITGRAFKDLKNEDLSLH